MALATQVRLQALQVRPKMDRRPFELDGKVTRPQGDMWLAGILECPEQRFATAQDNIKVGAQ